MSKISSVSQLVRALPLDKIPPRYRRRIMTMMAAYAAKQIGKKVFK